MVFVRRGAIITTFIVCYALTSFISGYVSGGLYSRNGGMVLHNFLLILMFVCTIQFLCNLCFHIVPSWSSPSKRVQFKLSCMEYPYLSTSQFKAYQMLLEFMAGKNWIKAMVLTASLFPFLCFSIGFALNTIAIFYRSLAAIPFGTMVVMFVLWAFISFPLVLLGTVVGRNWSGAPNNPCRVKTIPRPIPEKKWYLTPSVISLMGGLLPFGSIFIEMYFVFTSFWNYKVNKQMLFYSFDLLETLTLLTVLLYCTLCMFGFFFFEFPLVIPKDVYAS
ncbi:Transmembrane 9 superfamily member 1 [Zea mays]|uniref:Transmembrane 9 superfamily member n=1 Tax=Zea mays TaxID=4577 RepID=A0A1D6MYS4_MAIZE|nr:Transmembrane 9 superfamily member 1 [Zea mays]